MKVVIDANVFISGIFFSGPPSRILEAWKNRRFEIILSRQIISEYQRVAEELSSKFPAIDIMPIIEMLTIHGTFVDTKNLDISLCKDPDDDKFIECAVAGGCKIIISGDKHLLSIKKYQDITILTPRHFVLKFMKFF
jgi:putative PIN family toxin of toxin-antitoxin system